MSRTAADAKSIPLGELDPDFVISVKYDVGGTAGGEQQLEGLLKALNRVGFYSQVRAGEDSSLLVFIKLSSTALRKTLRSASTKKYLYGGSSDIGTTDEELENVSGADKLREGFALLESPEYEGGVGLTPGEGAWKAIEKIIPLYDYGLNKRLIKSWSTKRIIDERDIETIKGVAGEKVALYFAFLKFYTTWLTIPAVLGVISFVFFKRYSIVFTILNLLWSIVFINAWKKKEAVYSIQWNTKDASLIEIKRSQFVGETQEVDLATGLKIPYSTPWKRVLKQVAFIPVALGTTVILISYQLLCFFIEIFLNELYDGPGKKYLSFVPTVLISAFVPILTSIYSVFVDKAMVWENHETNNSYNRSYVQKQFVLNFLTSYIPLLITSFLYLPFGYRINPYLASIQGYTSKYNISIQQKGFQINKNRLNQQFLYFAVTNQVIGFFVENFLPVIIQKLKEFLNKEKKVTLQAVSQDSPEEAQFLKQVREQISLPSYDVDDEYREMVIQFGYLAIFGPVWSLAPLVSLLNNWVEFRGDVTKLLLSTHRPIPEKVDTIAPWDTNLRLLIWCGTLVSPALTAMFRQSDLLAESEHAFFKSPVRIPPWYVLAVILLSEHISIVLNLIVDAIFKTISTKIEADHNLKVLKDRRAYALSIVQNLSFGNDTENPVVLSDNDKYWESHTTADVLGEAKAIQERAIENSKKSKENGETETKKTEIVTGSTSSYQQYSDISTSSETFSKGQPETIPKSVRESATYTSKTIPTSDASAYDASESKTLDPAQGFDTNSTVTSTVPSGLKSSNFNKNQLSSVAKAAYVDGSKSLPQVQSVINDTKNGNYSSAEQLASDFQKDPSSYIGTTRDAFSASAAKGSSPSSAVPTVNSVTNSRAASSVLVPGKDTSNNVPHAGLQGGFNSNQTSEIRDNGVKKTVSKHDTQSIASSDSIYDDSVAGATLPPFMIAGKSASTRQSANSAGVASQQLSGGAASPIISNREAEPEATKHSESAAGKRQSMFVEHSEIPPKSPNRHSTGSNITGGIAGAAAAAALSSSNGTHNGSASPHAFASLARGNHNQGRTGSNASSPTKIVSPANDHADKAAQKSNEHANLYVDGQNAQSISGNPTSAVKTNYKATDTANLPPSKSTIEKGRAYQQFADNIPLSAKGESTSSALPEHLSTNHQVNPFNNQQSAKPDLAASAAAAASHEASAKAHTTTPATKELQEHHHSHHHHHHLKTAVLEHETASEAGTPKKKKNLFSSIKNKLK